MYVPYLKLNLISVSTIENSGRKIEFENCACRILENLRVIAEGARRNGLYELNTTTTIPSDKTEIGLAVKHL